MDILSQSGCNGYFLSGVTNKNHLCHEWLLSGDCGTTKMVVSTCDIQTDCWEMDYLWVTSPADAALTGERAASSEQTCCSCVRAPLGESLSPPLLSPQLPFPKEKKRRTRSGEEGRRHYRKAGRNTTFTHSNLLLNRPGREQFVLQ